MCDRGVMSRHTLSVAAIYDSAVDLGMADMGLAGIGSAAAGNDKLIFVKVVQLIVQQGLKVCLRMLGGQYGQ